MKAIDNNRKNMIISLILNLAIVAMEIVAFKLSLDKNGSSLIKFYTEDSNLLAAAACLIMAVFTARALKRETPVPAWVGVLKYTAVCCLLLTFLVVILVLGPMIGTIKGFLFFLFGNSMLYHHFLCPVTAFISFIFFEKGFDIRKKHVGIALIPTSVYAAALLALNISGAIVGPYPFLRVHEQSIGISVMWMLLIFGIAYVISFFVHLIYTRR